MVETGEPKLNENKMSTIRANSTKVRVHLRLASS